MMSEIDLKEAERRIYLSYFDDGIVDLVAGLVVLGFGLGMVFDESMLFIFCWMPILFFWPLKRAITLPRIGYVKFSPERQSKISKNMVLMMIAGLAALLLGVFAFLGVEGEAFNTRDFMLEYSLLVFGAVMAGAFALIALLFEVRRFYGYAAIVFTGWLIPYLLEIPEGIPVAAAGGTIMLIGGVFLVRFMTNYPIAAE